MPKSSLHTPDSTAGVPGTGKEGHESIQSGSEWEEEKDIRVLSVQSMEDLNVPVEASEARSMEYENKR